MVQIFLVRHGQANSEAKDEVSYDKLSPLGKIQAGWLGQYFKKNEFTLLPPNKYQTNAARLTKYLIS